MSQLSRVTQPQGSKANRKPFCRICQSFIISEKTIPALVRRYEKMYIHKPQPQSEQILFCKEMEIRFRTDYQKRSFDVCIKNDQTKVAGSRMIAHGYIIFRHLTPCSPKWKTCSHYNRIRIISLYPSNTLLRISISMLKTTFASSDLLIT